MRGRIYGRAPGFTLVELLVVFSIVGLLIMLVAPIGVKQIEKARAQEEWLVLSRTVESLAFRAFAEGREVRIEAKGGEILWYLGDEPVRSKTWHHLFFDPTQQIAIDTNGIADHDRISVRQGGAERALLLNRWLASH